MSRSTALAATRARRPDRLARAAGRLLRTAADARLALGLLLLAGAWNAAAAALPSGTWQLATPPYLVLLALILGAGVASVAVRMPAAWREWRRPAVLTEGAEVMTVEVPRMGRLFGGAALLVACLAVALWLPRRRLTLRQVDGALRLLLRGERFDRPDADLEAVRRRLATALDRECR